jgi:hypothetical protein
LLRSPIGTVFEKDEFTNYDSLGKLVDKFNEKMKCQGMSELDNSLIDLRDAFAHGRVFTLEGEDFMRLVKFGKPDKSGARVCLEFNEVMSEEWLASCIKRVCEAMFYVCSQMPCGSVPAHGIKD